MRRDARLPRSFEARAGILAALVLTVLTAGTASALTLEESAREQQSVPPAPAPEARVVDDPGLTVVAAWQVAATAVQVTLVEPVPEPPPAAAPAPAQAAPAVPADPQCGGDGWHSRRGQAALDGLRRPSDAGAFQLSFEPGRSGMIGLATVHEGRMQVFVRSCADLPMSLLQHVVAHELGHLVDGARLGDEQRSQWLAARGIAAGTPWYGCNSCTDFATPAGDFAEVYAQWQTGASANRSQLAPAPSAGELADLAARFF